MKKYSIALGAIFAIIAMTMLGSIGIFTTWASAVSTCNSSGHCSNTNLVGPGCCTVTAGNGKQAHSVSNTNPGIKVLVKGDPTAAVNPGGDTSANSGSQSVHTPP